MAAQEWNFDVLDNDYNHLQGALWAGFDPYADAVDVAEHWSSDTWNEPAEEPAAVNDNAQRALENQRALNNLPPLEVAPQDLVNVPEHLLDVPASQVLPRWRRPSHDQHASNPHQAQNHPSSLSHILHPSEDIDPATLQRSAPEGSQHNHTREDQQTTTRQSQAVGSDSDYGDDGDEDDIMPPRRQPTVDLTQSPNMAPPSASQESRRRRRSSAVDTAEEGTSRKRVKRGSGSAARVEIEDLEDEAPSADAELLQAQQREALKMQETNKHEEGVKIGQKSCIICLENYTNATTSSCGHIFCHECLTRALMASEKNNDRGKGNCPACRKAISRKNAKDVIPISFLKKSAFQNKGRQAHNR